MSNSFTKDEVQNHLIDMMGFIHNEVNFMKVIEKIALWRAEVV